MGDIISIVERIYQSAVDDEAWLGSICEAAAAVTGSVVFGNFVDAKNLAEIRYWAEVVAGVPASLNALPVTARSAPPEIRQALYEQATRVETVSERLARAGLSSAALHRLMAPLGLGDGLGVPEASFDGRGCGMMLGLPVARRITAAERRRWEKVAAHLGAGSRLRTEVASAAAPEAVLRTDGRVEHAEPAAQSTEAREALRGAARAIDRARSLLRRDDPDSALDLWTGLVAGQWSLVDRFESDGRRYLIARRNDPDAPTAGGLSRREAQVAALAAVGHSNKLIAYELGLAVSTVATHLATARRKLRTHSRLDLAPLAIRKPG